MSDKELRKQVIKLAHDKPELRPHLLPLLKTKEARSPRKGSRYLNLIRDFHRDPTHEGQAELSDFGVNMLREEGRMKGYDQRDLDAIYREEMARMRQHNIPPGPDGWAKYRKVNRAGSEYLLSAKMRMALLMIWTANHLL